MKSCIQIFGDSITFGEVDLENGGWANLLSLQCMKLYGEETKVYNLGVSSDTSTGLLSRFASEYSFRKSSSRRNVVVFAIGINDSRFYGSAPDGVETDLELFESNLHSLVKLALENGADDVIFVGLTAVNEKLCSPTIWRGDEHFTNAQSLAYDAVIARVAVELECGYVSLTGEITESELSEKDGLHPNSSGHQKIFAKVYEHLRQSEILE